MGLFDDIIKGLNALSDFKKADAEQIKAKTQESKKRKLSQENRKLKKNLSNSNKIGIIGVGVAIFSIVIAIILWYFPAHTT